MKKALTVLVKKIQWNLDDIQHQIEQLKQTIEDKIIKVYQLNHQNSENHNPSVIYPEKEMARLNLFIHQQQQLAQLELQIKDHQEQLAALDKRKIRLHSELKMIERYKAKHKLLSTGSYEN